MSENSGDRETQIPWCTLIHPQVVFGITTPSRTCGIDAACVQTHPTQTGRTSTDTEVNPPPPVLSLIANGYYANAHMQ